jgi:hypothetical protein
MSKKTITQALPNVRRLANLRQYATREWKNFITDLAAKAYRPVLEDDDEEPFAVIVAPVRVQQLAEEYVSAKHYRMPLKEFRKITSKSGNSLRNKVQELLEIIPDDAQPPLSQMREKFCNVSRICARSCEDYSI